MFSKLNWSWGEKEAEGSQWSTCIRGNIGGEEENVKIGLTRKSFNRISNIFPILHPIFKKASQEIQRKVTRGKWTIVNDEGKFLLGPVSQKPVMSIELQGEVYEASLHQIKAPGISLFAPNHSEQVCWVLLLLLLCFCFLKSQPWSGFSSIFSWFIPGDYYLKLSHFSNISAGGEHGYNANGLLWNCQTWGFRLRLAVALNSLFFFLLWILLSSNKIHASYIKKDREPSEISWNTWYQAGWGR